MMTGNAARIFCATAATSPAPEPSNQHHDSSREPPDRVGFAQARAQASRDFLSTRPRLVADVSLMILKRSRSMNRTASCL